MAGMGKTVVTLATAGLVTPNLADDIDTERARHADAFSAPDGATFERGFEVSSLDAASTSPGGAGTHGMLNSDGFLGRVVPDLTCVPQTIRETDTHPFIMRGLALGTPVGSVFGVEPATGESFQIMSIDNVPVEDALIPHV